MYSNRDRISNIGVSQDLSKADKKILDEKRKQEMEQNSAYREFNDAKNLIKRLENELRRQENRRDKAKIKIEEYKQKIIERDKKAEGKKGVDAIMAGISQVFDSDLENLKATQERVLNLSEKEMKDLRQKLDSARKNSLELEKRYNKEKQDVKNATKLATESHKKGVEIENNKRLLENAQKEVNRLSNIKEKNNSKINKIDSDITKKYNELTKNKKEFDLGKKVLESYGNKKSREDIKEYAKIESSNIRTKSKANEIILLEKDIERFKNQVIKLNNEIQNNAKEKNNLINENKKITGIISQLRKNNTYQNLAKYIQDAKKIA